nr:hypothetical protein LOCMHKOF_00141 [Providencia stuartii]
MRQREWLGGGPQDFSRRLVGFRRDHSVRRRCGGTPSVRPSQTLRSAPLAFLLPIAIAGTSQLSKLRDAQCCGGTSTSAFLQLRAGGHRNSHANAGVVPAIAFAQNNRGEVRFESGHGQVACTVLSNGKPGYGVPMVACVSLRGREQGLAAELGGSVAATLRTSGGGADKPHVLAPDFEAHFRYDWNDPGPGDWSHWRVRRLMPTECERLQGMPDDYTLIPYRGKPAADAPRYKAIGNSMAVPCMAWLGQRLVQCLHKTGSTASDWSATQPAGRAILPPALPTYRQQPAARVSRLPWVPPAPPASSPRHLTGERCPPGHRCLFSPTHGMAATSRQGHVATRSISGEF